MWPNRCRQGVSLSLDTKIRYRNYRMKSIAVRTSSRKNGSSSIWDTHEITINVFFFANSTTSSSAPFLQELNPWSSNVSEHTSPHVIMWKLNTSFSNNHGTDQQRLQISDLHFEKFTTSTTFPCWRIRFKTEVRTCSQFLTEALLWIKEVEFVYSVGDLKSSCSVKGIHMPNFEVLDAKIASVLNRIIHNIQFKRKVSLEEEKVQKEDRFLRGNQIASLIYEYCRITSANDSVENYADLFTIGLRNDDIQEFDSKWDGIQKSMT